jgi:hypothetical protein
MEKIRIRDGEIRIRDLGINIRIRNTGRMALRSPEGDVLLTKDLVAHVGDVVKHCLVLHHKVLLKYPVRLH